MVVDWLAFLVPPLLVLVWLALIFGPMIVVRLLEKHHVWPFEPPEESNVPTNASSFDDSNPYAATCLNKQGPHLTEYAIRMNDTAEALSFRRLGVFADSRGKLYRVRYDCWESPARNILLVIGGGKLGSVPAGTTVLFTLLDNGRCLTTFNSRIMEPDVSGLENQALMCTRNLERLVQFHRRRMSAERRSIVTCCREGTLHDYREFCVRQAGRLEQLGYARFLDRDRSVMRYTLRGAVKFTAWAFLISMRRLVWPDRFRLRSRQSKYTSLAVQREGLPMAAVQGDDSRQSAARDGRPRA